MASSPSGHTDSKQMLESLIPSPLNNGSITDFLTMPRQRQTDRSSMANKTHSPRVSLRGKQSKKKGFLFSLLFSGLSVFLFV